MTLGIEISRPRWSFKFDQGDLVEAVDIDDQIELLTDRQEVGQHEQLLGLLVPFVTETQRDQLFVPEERVLPQSMEQRIRADLTEPHSDRSAEDADHELSGVGFDEGVVADGQESEVIGRQSRRWRRLQQALRDIERRAGPVRGAEVQDGAPLRSVVLHASRRLARTVSDTYRKDDPYPRSKRAGRGPPQRTQKTRTLIVTIQMPRRTIDRHDNAGHS